MRAAAGSSPGQSQPPCRLPPHVHKCTQAKLLKATGSLCGPGHPTHPCKLMYACLSSFMGSAHGLLVCVLVHYIAAVSFEARFCTGLAAYRCCFLTFSTAAITCRLRDVSIHATRRSIWILTARVGRIYTTTISTMRSYVRYYLFAIILILYY